MSHVAVRADNLGKRYRLGDNIAPYKTLRESLSGALRVPVSRLGALVNGGETAAKSRVDGLWALRDVSFEVGQGEVLGIIGRNGAGKSTLLKILSRITEPTTGRAEVCGRVGSLLEVGTGFHPELTGRENIFLNGAILGMARAEVQRRFDEIVEFAELNRFLDTPVKRYSSGMYTRLAFAVAAHLEPEILLVDEVLAVGDAAFQRKCLGKMGRVARGGRTVLFVSHNMAAVESLSDRVIWLDEGQIALAGSPGGVVSSYLQKSFASLTEQVWSDPALAPGNAKVRLRCARVHPLCGEPSDFISTRTPIVLEFEYWNFQPDAHLNLSLHLYNERGILAFNTAPVAEAVWQGRPFPAGLFRDTCHIPGDLLNDGLHRVELLVVQDDTRVIHRQDDILAFDVQDDVAGRGAWYGKWPGAVRPRLDWRTELLEEWIGTPPPEPHGLAHRQTG